MFDLVSHGAAHITKGPDGTLNSAAFMDGQSWERYKFAWKMFFHEQRTALKGDYRK